MAKKISTSKKIVIPGSEKKAIAEAKPAGKIDNAERIEITVLIRPQGKIASRAEFHDMMALPPSKRRYLTREQWAADHGADPADLAAVESYAHDHELTVVRSSAAERSVVLSGTISALTKAFSVNLKRVSLDRKHLRMRTGGIGVPAELADIIIDIKGFDDRPQACPHFRMAPVAAQKKANSKAKKKKVTARADAAAVPRSFDPTEVGKLYNFPANADGEGQCIAIIELGGGYKTADLNTYFKGLGLPSPSVTAVSVDGGKNEPGGDADGEVMLDIEVAAAIAPKATIAVYFAPNTDQGFLDAIKAAVHDALRKPSVISISWGSPETNWTAQSLRNYDEAFQEAAALGVTVLVAAGDHGSSDVDPNDTRKRVDFPSASPWVLSCGGTHLEAAGDKIASETVWNNGDGWATGGGVSAKFPRPAYQKDAGVPKLGTGAETGRGVPDVAGNADSATGYKVRVDGKNTVIGGTSAVAPLWAGLVALWNQKLGKPVGFLNSFIYTPAGAQGTFRDITEGDNGGYSAGAGWDPCTGLGTPDGAKLLTALQGGAPHATPSARRPGVRIKAKPTAVAIPPPVIPHVVPAGVPDLDQILPWLDHLISRRGYGGPHSPDTKLKEPADGEDGLGMDELTINALLNDVAATLNAGVNRSDLSDSPSIVDLAVAIRTDLRRRAAARG